MSPSNFQIAEAIWRKGRPADALWGGVKEHVSQHTWPNWKQHRTHVNHTDFELLKIPAYAAIAASF
jgi:hypothetical protein